MVDFVRPKQHEWTSKMTDETGSPKHVDSDLERSERHTREMQEHFKTFEGTRDEFNSSYALQSIARLPHTTTGEQLAVTVLSRAVLRDSRIFFTGHHYDSSRCLDVEISRGGDGRLAWVAKTPNETFVG
ncbi:hypothetical protein LJR290_007466 [Variovorax sp. LjRoot290]|uniref:hypothetical protein n=1 Tax=Variovorax sp. LjRoot290 TaxID=3342316 RepID=UPI003ED05BA0